MPRRPRPAHRVRPGQIQKSNHRAPPLSTKSRSVSKAQLGEPNSKSTSSKVTLEEESSFSEDLKEGSREEYELGTRNSLKRGREEEDEDEDKNDEVDTETDVDADADAPRVVQWLDDEDDTLPGRSWEDELKRKVTDEVRLYFRS